MYNWHVCVYLHQRLKRAGKGEIFLSATEFFIRTVILPAERDDLLLKTSKWRLKRFSCSAGINESTTLASAYSSSAVHAFTYRMNRKIRDPFLMLPCRSMASFHPFFAISSRLCCIQMTVHCMRVVLNGEHNWHLNELNSINYNHVSAVFVFNNIEVSLEFCIN